MPLEVSYTAWNVDNFGDDLPVISAVFVILSYRYWTIFMVAHDASITIENIVFDFVYFLFARKVCACEALCCQ